VWHAVPVFNMSTAHDADDQRPPRIATLAGDCLGHGAVPELLRADETFKPFRGCAGILTSGWVLLKPLKQTVSIGRRGRRRIADTLPLGAWHGCQSLCRNPTVGRSIDIERQHRQAMHSGEMEQRQVELVGEAPDTWPIDLAEEGGFVQLALG